MLAAEKIHTLSIARPQADQFRLAALHRYHILDTPACEDFSFLTELATQICGVPYAVISLVDAERVWIKACAGMRMGELPRGDSVCSLAVLGEAITEIPDLSQDFRTARMTLAVEAPFVRMYTGVALTSADGFAIGTLCVMDTKPGRLGEVQRAMLVKLARQVMALIELRANAQTLTATVRELEELATTDELTGLHNRRSLLHRLKFETARAKRFRSPLSAVMIDLDHFKQINDDHGHAVGDQVLANVGRLLRESVRVIDIPGRYGGEELCVILPNTPLEGACKFAETLRAKLEAQLHYAGPRLLPVTASFGVGSFDHMEIADAESLLRQADTALYRAKHAGRNRVECGAP
ncbi:GGDEF domain-containing protein [Duganella aceris]|jgi:diguanylate cyclase (GGDEF)-like protein|uniref:diguanylate cyclase n=1 Tax=Duganella aceris TaxID=2703883 RepID=A0ABX0FPW7_9BURK|nr:sensor domain-containing diguanylate cyclase [Duganella aceris]NGZ86585.1 sensor domain-containing diguanylate cyclase [Duganella aceris]